MSGPTGAGKSFLASALTHAAIRRGHTALYVRTPRLLAELAFSRGDRRYVPSGAVLEQVLGLELATDRLGCLEFCWPRARRVRSCVATPVATHTGELDRTQALRLVSEFNIG
jgi:hypothetical protein